MANKLSWMGKLKGLFSGSGGSGAQVTTSSLLMRGTSSPGTTFDLSAELALAWLNGPVAATVEFLGNSVTEANLQVERERGGKRNVIKGHSLAELIRRPNPFMSGTRLWKATVRDYVVHGNAYWRVEHDADGIPARLWYVPYREMEPRWDASGDHFLTGYLYTGASPAIFYPIEKRNVIHFANGQDPRNTRFGVSLVEPVVKELTCDTKTAAYYMALLENYGVFGGMLMPEDADVVIPEEERTRIKEQFRQFFTKDGRGGLFLPPIRMVYQGMAFSPNDLALTDIQRFIATRVYSALQVNAMVIGDSAGLERSTFSNYDQAYEAAFERGVKPIAKALSETLEVQLLPKFVGSDPRWYCTWNYSEVSSMQEDNTELVNRWNSIYENKGCDRAEYREGIGLEVRPEDIGHYYNQPDEGDTPPVQPVLPGADPSAPTEEPPAGDPASEEPQDERQRQDGQEGG